MARLTGQQAADKAVARGKAAIQEYKDGVQRVSVAPGQLAARKKEKMRAGINEALDSGKWERNVASVSLQEWQNLVLNKGAGRISAGLDAAKAKMAAEYDRMFAFQDGILSKIAQMPDNTIDERIARSVAWQQAMHEYRRQSRA